MAVAVLLDLDGTLIDSRASEPCRRQRDWRGAVRALSQCRAFDGIQETCAQLRRDGRRIAVVTSSVSFYAEAALKRFAIEYDTLVAWHDTTRHKPGPEPYLEALRRLGLQSPRDAIGVGDLEEDALALGAARVRSVGAVWSPTFVDGSWSERAQHPREVLRFA
jgi:beta-phosphoglucomutase-like phosphatase (HAD superfamily)